MSIVATEIESIHGAVGQQRMIFYRCQDSEGAWHSYGPLFTSDPNFDPESVMAAIANKVGAALADAEAQELISG